MLGMPMWLQNRRIKAGGYIDIYHGRRPKTERRGNEEKKIAVRRERISYRRDALL